MSAEIVLDHCPGCNEIWINPQTQILCASCAELAQIGQVVLDTATAVKAVDKLNLNKLTPQHRRILKGAADQLAAILETLNRYPG